MSPRHVFGDILDRVDEAVREELWSRDYEAEAEFNRRRDLSCVSDLAEVGTVFMQGCMECMSSVKFDRHAK
eukprot:5767446-Lingulodinium_polyedra.AAC.1